MSTPPPAPSTSPARPNRTRFYVGAAVAVVVAVLLIAVFVVPLLTGSGTGSAAAVLTYSGARPVADHAAGNFEGGGWSLLFAAGLVSATAEPIPENTTVLGNLSCTFTPATLPGSLSLPAYAGNRSSGLAPAWEFGYRNSTDTLALVSVINGQAIVLGTLTGFECALFSQVFTPVPGNAIDSSQAVAAVQPEAREFLAAHPNVSAEFALVGGYSFGGHAPGAEWDVIYNTCPLSSTAIGSGVEFNATVNALTGAVVSTNLSSDVPCGSAAPLNEVSSSLYLGLPVTGPIPPYTSYSINISFAANGITWANLTAGVENGVTPVTSGWTLTAVSAHGTTIATYEPLALAWSGNGTQAIAAGDRFVLTTTVDLSGDTFAVQGVGTFGGGEGIGLP